ELPHQRAAIRLHVLSRETAVVTTEAGGRDRRADQIVGPVVDLACALRRDPWREPDRCSARRVAHVAAGIRGPQKPGQSRAVGGATEIVAAGYVARLALVQHTRISYFLEPVRVRGSRFVREGFFTLR